MRKVIQPIVAGAGVVVALATPAAADKPSRDPVRKQASISDPKAITDVALRQLVHNRSQAQIPAKAPRFDSVVAQTCRRQDVVQTLRGIEMANQPSYALEKSPHHWF